MNLAPPIAPPMPGRTRILEVVGNAIVGGMETYVARLIERVPRDRFTVTALCPFESRFTDQLRALDVEVLITAMPDDPTWSSIMNTCALVRAGAIDVLHAHLPHAHLLAGLVGSLCNKPVLTTIHSRHLSPMDLEVHRAAGTHVSVVCTHAYFHALSMGVNASQLSCIPNGVDTDIFKPGPRSEGGIRAQLGVANEVPVVGFVGRLSVEKGPEIFLRAALLLRSLVPQAHFVMVGEGPMQAELAEFVRRFQLQDHVHLLGLRRDMVAVYRELDVVVSSSHSEAMPLALMEAMASGLPVVATRVGGVPDLVEHGATGWLAGPRDFEGIASRVAEVLNNPGARERMGRLARERVVERMSLQDSVDSTLQLLSRLAASSAAPRPAFGAVVGGAARKQTTSVGRAAAGGVADGA